MSRKNIGTDSFASRLVGMMERVNATQAAIAARCGVSQGTVSAWINGAIPQPRSARDLAHAFGVNVAWLLYGTGERLNAESAATGEQVMRLLPIPSGPPIESPDVALLNDLEASLAVAREQIDECAKRIAKARKRLGRLAEKSVDVPTPLAQLSPVQIADRLKRKRKALGLTQEQAAAEWGVPVSTLRNWEQGKRQPRGLAVRQLETILRTAGKPSE